MKRSAIGKLFYLAAVLPVIMITIGCSAAPDKEAEFKGVPEDVTFCHSSRLDTLLLIAHEQGYLKENGINAALKQFSTGGHAIARMINVECDVVVCGSNPFVFQSFNHSDLRIISIVGESDNSSRIIARKDRGIDSPKDLKGKKIAAQKGTVFHFFLSLFLAKHGLTTKDIALSFARAEELNMEDAWSRFNAISLKEPYSTNAIQFLGDNAVVFEDKGLVHQTFVAVARDSFIKEKPAATNGILRALIAAEQYSKDYPKQAFELISKTHSYDETLWNSIMSDITPVVALKQSLLITLEDSARWMIREKLTDKTTVPNYLDFIYTESLESVMPARVSIIK